MELRTNEQQKKMESGGKAGGGLRLSGVDNDKMLRQAKASQQEDWDFSQDIEPVQIKVAESRRQRETLEKREMDVPKVLLMMSQVVLYGLLAAEIASLAYVTSLEPVSVISNAMTFKGLFSVCAIYFIIDAVLVNVFFESKLSLIFFAWLLPFLYPGMRHSHVKGKAGIGGFISVIYFLSLCGFIAFAGQQYRVYGGLLLEEDTTVRATASELLNQSWENGKTLGNIFDNRFSIEEVAVVQKGNQVSVAFSGKGTINLQEDVFTKSMSGAIPTRMVFTKKDSDTKFTLSAVTVKGTELTERGVQNYWKELLK